MLRLELTSIQDENTNSIVAQHNIVHGHNLCAMLVDVCGFTLLKHAIWHVEPVSIDDSYTVDGDIDAVLTSSQTINVVKSKERQVQKSAQFVYTRTVKQNMAALAMSMNGGTPVWLEVCSVCFVFF